MVSPSCNIHFFLTTLYHVRYEAGSISFNSDQQPGPGGWLEAGQGKVIDGCLPSRLAKIVLLPDFLGGFFLDLF